MLIFYLLFTVIDISVVACPVPPLQEFSVAIPKVDQVQINESITFRCSEGYEITGTTQTEVTATCQPNGSLDLGPPSCLSKANFCIIFEHNMTL